MCEIEGERREEGELRVGQWGRESEQEGEEGGGKFGGVKGLSLFFQDKDMSLKVFSNIVLGKFLG